MAADSKRAHGDLRLSIEGPKEELDVIAERPQDLSTSLEYNLNKNKGLVESLDHLGNISDNANNLNRTINAYDLDVDYKLRAEQIRLEQQRLEETAKLQMFNTVSEKRFEMIRDIEKAKDMARSSGNGDVLGAVQGEMEKYRDAFSDSFEGSQMWSQIYAQQYAHEIENGSKATFEIEHAKFEHNVNQLTNEAFRNVVMGDLNVEGALQKILATTSEARQVLPREKYLELMDLNYQDLVIGKALYFSKVATGSNASEVAGSIRNLIDTYYKRQFDCLTPEGRQLTDDQGNPVIYEATLTPTTIQKLLAVAQELENKSSAGSRVGSAKSFDVYKQHVGGESLETLGQSDYLMFATPSFAKQDYEALLNNINSDKDLTLKQKIDETYRISRYYHTIVAPSVAINDALKVEADSSVNYSNVQQKLAELDKKLDSGENMDDFELSFDRADGSTYILKPDVYDEAAGIVNQSEANRVYWSNIRDSLLRTMKAKTTADFMYGTNAPYTQSVNSAKLKADRNYLVTANGMDNLIKDKSVEELTNDLNNMFLVHIDSSGGKPGKYASIPSTFFSEIVSQYNEAPSDSFKQAYARAIANAWSKSKYSGILASKSFLKGKSDEEKKAFLAIQKELFISNPDLSEVRNTIQQAAKHGSSFYTMEEAESRLKEESKKTGDARDIKNKISELMRTHKIPGEYQDSLPTILYNIALDYKIAYNSLPSINKESAKNLGQEAANADDNGKIKEVLEKVVKSNFKQIDSPYTTASVYIGNPALLQDKNKKDYTTQLNNIGYMVTEVGDGMYNAFKRMGYPVSKSSIDTDFDEIDGNIKFRVTGNRLGLINKDNDIYSHAVGIPHNYMQAKPDTMSEKDWRNEVSDHISVSAVLSFVKDTETVPNKKVFIDPVSNSPVDHKVIQADAIRMLSVLQSDSFLKDYSDFISAGGTIGSSKAPRYIKDLFTIKEEVAINKPSNQFLLAKAGIPTKTIEFIPDNINTMLDFAYARSVAFNKVNTTINKPLSYDVQGLNFTGVLEEAKKTGFTITRGMDNNSYGNYTSSHSFGMALDFGVNTNGMINHINGLVKVSSMEKFTDMLTKNPAYANRVSKVLTSRPELLENKPEYAEYAKFRELKNSEGKPLFVDARTIDKKLNPKNHHTNHFHVEFKTQVIGLDKNDLYYARDTIAADMVNTSNKSNTQVTLDRAKALLATFGNNFYNKEDKLGRYGMANLTKAEYEMLSMNDKLSFDPILQARALANRFQAYANALGSEDLAIYALAGSKFVNQEDKKISTIQDILNSGKIAGVGGVSFVVASPKKNNGEIDTKEQKRLNSIYSTYKSSLRKIRGAK